MPIAVRYLGVLKMYSLFPRSHKLYLLVSPCSCCYW